MNNKENGRFVANNVRTQTRKYIRGWKKSPMNFCHQIINDVGGKSLWWKIVFLFLTNILHWQLNWMVWMAYNGARAKEEISGSVANDIRIAVVVVDDAKLWCNASEINNDGFILISFGSFSFYFSEVKCTNTLNWNEIHFNLFLFQMVCSRYFQCHCHCHCFAEANEFI